jgi:hypothetical protein
LFQLNPLLNPQNFSQKSPTKQFESENIKQEPSLDELIESKLGGSTFENTPEAFDAWMEQKNLNEGFQMIRIIESSLVDDEDEDENGFCDLSETFLDNLLDDNLTQFRIQLPLLQVAQGNFLTCEIGSRVLFKTIGKI